MTPYLPRIVDAELDELLRGVAAIAIQGPKGVGKTVTAQRRARSVVALDDPAVHAIARADARAILQRPKPILIDEWQRVPATWDAVRRAVDDDRTPGQFLLTGSASPRELPAHTGAGRIVDVRMRPLALSERGLGTPCASLGALLRGERPALAGTTPVTLVDYVDEIVASGLPGLRALQGRALRAQLDGYLQRLVDREFSEQGLAVRSPQALLRWLTAYAAATSTTASFEKTRDAASAGEASPPPRSTVRPYRDVLERLWIVDAIPAWLPSGNLLNRLSQPPKHQLADPALAVRLLGLDRDALLAGRTSGHIQGTGSLLGRLFESLVAQSVRAYAQHAEARVHHLRTKAGERDVDLVVARGDQRIVAIEVKLGGTVADADTRNLRWLRQQLGDTLLDAIVVNTGPAAYRREDGIGVVPAALLGP